MSSDPSTIRQLYGRRQGHRLRSAQSNVLAEILPRIAVPQQGMISTERLFGQKRELWLEIGFGKGEHLIAQAIARPEIGLIGCEPFVNGVAAATRRCQEARLDNVRLHAGDALEILERLPDDALTKVFLLHPDPWPKARHAKRRFVNPGPLDLVATKMAPGSELRIGTDHPAYCRWTLMQLASHSRFEWLADSPDDWQRRREDWPGTRYEAKARREQREVWYFRFRRR